MRQWRCVIVIAAMSTISPCLAENAPSSPDAQLYIIWPRDGSVIDGGKFWLRMGLREMGVAPAGVEMEGTGHHHVLIDTDIPPLDEPIPADNNHLHFGLGHSEARISGLAPGEHTLQLILGDHNHIPHEPPVISEKITITVLPY